MTIALVLRKQKNWTTKAESEFGVHCGVVFHLTNRFFGFLSLASGCLWGQGVALKHRVVELWRRPAVA